MGWVLGETFMIPRRHLGNFSVILGNHLNCAKNKVNVTLIIVPPDPPFHVFDK